MEKTTSTHFRAGSAIHRHPKIKYKRQNGQTGLIMHSALLCCIIYNKMIDTIKNPNSDMLTYWNDLVYRQQLPADITEVAFFDGDQCLNKITFNLQNILGNDSKS